MLYLRKLNETKNWYWRWLYENGDVAFGGYVHEGEEAPDLCPKCRQGKEVFIKVAEEKSKY